MKSNFARDYPYYRKLALQRNTIGIFTYIGIMAIAYFIYLNHMGFSTVFDIITSVLQIIGFVYLIFAFLERRNDFKPQPPKVISATYLRPINEPLSKKYPHNYKRDIGLIKINNKKKQALNCNGLSPKSSCQVCKVGKYYVVIYQTKKSAQAEG